MDITYLSLAVTLAAITIALVYAISRNTGRT
jgi:hypothetical protein